MAAGLRRENRPMADEGNLRTCPSAGWGHGRDAGDGTAVMGRLF
jgi:hypothetical protein